MVCQNEEHFGPTYWQLVRLSTLSSRNLAIGSIYVARRCAQATTAATSACDQAQAPAGSGSPRVACWRRCLPRLAATKHRRPRMTTPRQFDGCAWRRLQIAKFSRHFVLPYRIACDTDLQWRRLQIAECSRRFVLSCRVACDTGTLRSFAANRR